MLVGQRPDVCNMESEQRGRLGLISLSEQHARVCVLLAAKIFILLKERTTLKACLMVSYLVLRSGLESGSTSGC